MNTAITLPHIWRKPDKKEVFSYSIYEEQTHLEEHEFTAFVSSVTELFGPEEARSAAEDWLEEADLIDEPPRSIFRDWRSVTIAASARLSSRINAQQHSLNFLCRE